MTTSCEILYKYASYQHCEGKGHLLQFVLLALKLYDVYAQFVITAKQKYKLHVVWKCVKSPRTVTVSTLR